MATAEQPTLNPASVFDSVTLGRRADLLSLLGLSALALLFFTQLVLHPGQVLYSDTSDILAQHIPAKQFLVRSVHETGELPLWCPYSFAGSPFVHDPQVGIFYPPHLILYLLPEEAVGTGISWLIVFHVLLAGVAAYTYARSKELAPPAAFLVGAGFMFSGKWLMHLLLAGHYILIGMAWLPLVLLFLERAIQRRSFVSGTLAGALYALMALGTQPQWTFYSGIFLALWTLGTALEQAGYLGGEGPRSWRRTLAALARCAAYGAWVAILAIALAAVQLIPTLEAARYSTRSGGVAPDDVLEGGLRTFLFLIGPALQSEPTCLMWEDRGGLTLVWLIAATLAPLLCRGRVRYQAAVCAALVVFALGGSILFQWLPGFRYFRQPARMMVVVAFPLAFLAGTASQALFTENSLTPELRLRCRRMFLRLTIGAGILVIGYVVRMLLRGEIPRSHVYWVTLIATLPVAYWLLGAPAGVSRRRALGLWSVLLVADLFALSWSLVAVRAESDVYAASPSVLALDEARPQRWRVLDRDAPGDGAGTPLGGGAPLPMLRQVEPLRGYNPLDNRCYKEYLSFIADEDRPLEPLQDPLTFPVIGSFPIVNKSLLDLLGVGYLVQPSDFPDPDSETRVGTGVGWIKVMEDRSPSGYDFVAGGARPLPPFAVYENTSPMPRSFVVPEAIPAPERSEMLAALRGTDFRQRVLLDGWKGTNPSGATTFRPARIIDYRPNQVIVEAEGPGFLVLADPWFPGWVSTVDGRDAQPYRANHAFRAVELTEGPHQVVFRFEPQSYSLGRRISVAALGCLTLVMAVGCCRRIWRWRRPT
jgi:hypothetical protein